MMRWRKYWMPSERRCCKCEHLGGDQGICWGALPVCEGEGDPCPRGWWRGGPLSSSPPPAPGSAVQTAPPAPWPTPAEPQRFHTAPYTLNGPKGKEGGVTHLYRLGHRREGGCPTKINTPLDKSKIQGMKDFTGSLSVGRVISVNVIYLETDFV